MEGLLARLALPICLAAALAPAASAGRVAAAPDPYEPSAELVEPPPLPEVSPPSTAAPAPPSPGGPPGDGGADAQARPAQEPEAPEPADPERRGWFDASHRYLEEKLLAPVIRVDRFFADETELDVERARSFLRWRNEVRFEEEGSPSFRTGVRANVRLPAISRAMRRLRLVLEGETQEAFSALFPGENQEAGGQPVGEADAELRVGLFEGLLAHVDLGAGLMLEIPPGAFGRLRLRWAIPLGTRFLTRYALVGFYRTDEKFGASTDAHLERPLRTGVVTRLSAGARITQESDGVTWRSELATFVALGRGSAGSFGVAVNGATAREPVELEQFRAFTRFRREFFRRWIFFELQPEVYWPYTAERGRHATWGVTTRLEIQFHGREPEREPDEPEFADPAPRSDARGGSLTPQR